MNVPSLEAIARKRPEFAHGPRIWAETLAPALHARESARRETFRKVWRKTAIAAVIPWLLLLVFGVMKPFLFGAWTIVLAFGTPISIILIAGMDWLRMYAMKSATKELVLGAACQCFGFTYETLAPDVSGVSDYRSLIAAAKAHQARYGTPGARTGKRKRKRGGQTRITTPFGSARFGASDATGSECPTPAYDVLDDASLLPGHDSRHFEDLIKGTRAGAAFSLVEAKLETSGKNGATVFQGLLFHVQYPDRFFGRTLMARSRWWKRGKAAKDLQPCLVGTRPGLHRLLHRPGRGPRPADARPDGTPHRARAPFLRRKAARHLRGGAHDNRARSARPVRGWLHL